MDSNEWSTLLTTLHMLQPTHALMHRLVKARRRAAWILRRRMNIYLPAVVNCEPLSLRVFHLVRCIANLESWSLIDFATGHETAQKLVWSIFDNLKSQGGMQLLSEVTWKNGETLGSLGPALGCELTGTAALAKLKHHSIWIAKTNPTVFQTLLTRLYLYSQHTEFASTENVGVTWSDWLLVSPWLCWVTSQWLLRFSLSHVVTSHAVRAEVLTSSIRASCASASTVGVQNLISRSPNIANPDTNV